MPGPAERAAPAVLLVGHGSRLPSVKGDLARLAAEVGRLAGVEIEPCGLGTLGSALDRCAERGARQVLVQPHFLGFSGALASRLEALARGWRRADAGRRIEVGRTPGDHPLLTDLVRDGGLRALGGRRGTLLLAGHGSPEPGWSETMTGQARRLRALGVFDQVVAAFLEHEEPLLEDVLEELCGEVAVVAFFLSRGIHTSLEVPVIVEAARRPGIELRLAPFWGDDPRIAVAVAERVDAGLRRLVTTSDDRSRVRPVPGPITAPGEVR